MADYAFTEFREETERDFEEAAWPPTIFEFMGALSIWTACQSPSATVKKAASSFRVPEKLVTAAVIHEHSWMYLGEPGEDGSPHIHHDGI